MQRASDFWLPVEVWCHLVQQCDAATSIALSSTCKFLRLCSAGKLAELLCARTLSAIDRSQDTRRRNRLVQVQKMVLSLARGTGKDASRRQKTIECINSFERAFVHNLAGVVGLDHTTTIDLKDKPHFHVRDMRPAHCHRECRTADYSATPRSRVVVALPKDTPELCSAGNAQSKTILGSWSEFSARYPSVAHRSMDWCWYYERPDRVYKIYYGQ
jgi:hypothetical protein